jgi:hypothetical protein
MPIEIRELIIKATISEEGAAGGGDASGGEGGQDVIAACVEQVMDIIAKKEER